MLGNWKCMAFRQATFFQTHTTPRVDSDRQGLSDYCSSLDKHKHKSGCHGQVRRGSGNGHCNFISGHSKVQGIPTHPVGRNMGICLESRGLRMMMPADMQKPRLKYRDADPRALNCRCRERKECVHAVKLRLANPGPTVPRQWVIERGRPDESVAGPKSKRRQG